MRNNKGFSLVELIVVIAIMAILAAVAIPTFSSFINKANVASDEDFVGGIKYAVNLALTEDGDEAATITIVMNNDGKGVNKLSYTLENDDTDTVYVAMGTVDEDAGEIAAEDEIKELITTTIDNSYELKASVADIQVDDVTISLAPANNNP